MTRDQLTRILDGLKKHRPQFQWSELRADEDEGWHVEVEPLRDPRTLISPLARAGVMLIREDKIMGSADSWLLTLREWRE